MPHLGTLNTFVAGQTATASTVNQNFTDAKTAINSAMFSDLASTATAAHTFNAGAYVTGFKEKGPWVDVTHPSFAADPTGVGNSTAALKAAIAYAAANGLATVYAPAGIYLFDLASNKDNAVLLAAGVSLIGDGYATEFRVNPTSITGDATWYGLVYRDNCTVAGLRVNGQKASLNRTGKAAVQTIGIIDYDGAQNAVLRDLYAHNMPGVNLESFGIMVGRGSSGMRLGKLEGWDCEGTGIHISGEINTGAGDWRNTALMSNDIEAESLIGYDNDYSGVSLYSVKNIRVANITTEGNGHAGTNIEYTDEIDVFNMVSTGNTKGGLSCIGRANVRVWGGRITNNNSATSDYAEVYCKPAQWQSSSIYANLGTVELHGVSVTPVAGGRHLTFEPYATVTLGHSTPDQILLDCPDAHSWTIADPFRATGGVDAGLVFRAQPDVRPVSCGLLTDWTLGGSVTRSTVSDSDFDGGSCTEIATTATFGNLLTDYVLRENRRYLISAQVKPQSAHRWVLLAKGVSGTDTANVLTVPEYASDTGVVQWASIIVNTTERTRLQWQCNSTLTAATATLRVGTKFRVIELDAGSVSDAALSWGGRIVDFGTVAPTTGTYRAGDIRLNSSPSQGGAVGWVCVTGGTPGTWDVWGIAAPDTATLPISAASGTARTLSIYTGTSLRWTFGANNTAESGSNVGSDIRLDRYNDAGAFVSNVLGVNRNDGTIAVASGSQVQFNGKVVISATNGLQFGTGTVLKGCVVYSQSLTPVATAANTTVPQTFTITGLTTADVVFVNPPDQANACVPVCWRVTAADSLKVWFNNPTAGSLTSSSGVYAVHAWRS